MLSVIGSIAGVASLVLAVAGNNLERLTSIQRWGLALASAVMLFTFFGGLVFNQFARRRDEHEQAASFVCLFFGGLLGGGLLLAMIPFFGFGLPEAHVEQICLYTAGTFSTVCVLASLGVAVKK